MIIATEEGVTVIDNPETEPVYNTIEITSGDNQLGEMLSAVEYPLVVRISDGIGNYA